MLFGAGGQCLTMVLLAILGSINNSSTQIVSAVLLFVFNSFFAVGWLGMTWLYVSRSSYRSDIKEQIYAIYKFDAKLNFAAS